MVTAGGQIHGTEMADLGSDWLDRQEFLYSLPVHFIERLHILNSSLAAFWWIHGLRFFCFFVALALVWQLLHACITWHDPETKGMYVAGFRVIKGARFITQQHRDVALWHTRAAITGLSLFHRKQAFRKDPIDDNFCSLLKRLTPSGSSRPHSTCFILENVQGYTAASDIPSLKNNNKTPWKCTLWVLHLAGFGIEFSHLRSCCSTTNHPSLLPSRHQQLSLLHLLLTPFTRPTLSPFPFPSFALINKITQNNNMVQWSNALVTTALTIVPVRVRVRFIPLWMRHLFTGLTIGVSHQVLQFPTPLSLRSAKSSI